MALNQSPLSLRAALRTREVRVGIGVVLVFALALTGLYAVRASHASGFTVCASGCAYTSINAAITAASGGATITVGPGTYGPATSDNPIVINKALTLQGAGVGQSILNFAQAYQGTAATGGTTQVTNPGGNVTIEGFTFTGAAVNDHGNDDGIFINVKDNNAADTVTIQQNLFYEDNLIDPDLLEDQVDSIYINATLATTTITNNTFQGVFRAVLYSEGGGDGPTNFTNNVLNGLHGQYDITTNPPTLCWWAEGVFFLSDNATNQTAAHVISGNTFENYAGEGIGFDAGYPGGLIGSLSNFTISGNTFNVQGATGASCSLPGHFGDSYDIFLHGFGYTNGTVTSTISNMTIQNNVFNEASDTGNGYGIVIKGDVTTGITISHNAVHGSGAAPPIAAVNVICTDATTPCSATTPPGVSLTSNLVTGFQKGINSDTLPTGTSVAAGQNCIFGNTTDGAFSSDSGNTGAQINAQQNWWGAAGGPNTSGADSVAGNIDASNFLTAAAPACQGPVASGIATTPARVLVGNTFTLTASLSDTSTGGVSIASAQYSRDGGPTNAMSAQDGTFDQVTETVTATVPGIATPGIHTFCVQGADSQGNQGTATCVPITVYSPDTVALRATSTNFDYFRNSNTTGIANRIVTYGTAGDIPLAGDWTGKGYDSVGTYNSSTGIFSLRNTNTSGVADTTVLFGAPGDIPVVGDWTGKGYDSIGVWDPVTHIFSLRNSNSAGPADIYAVYGTTGDIPVVGDWTGKGYDSIGVYRPSTNQFFLRNSNTSGNADIVLTYGAAGDTPIVGDWTDQGKTTIGIYRASNSTFYLRNSNTTGNADIAFIFNPPASGKPFVGRWTTAGPYIVPRGGSRSARSGGLPRVIKGSE